MTVAELIEFLGQFPGECKVMVDQASESQVIDDNQMPPTTVRVEASAVEINQELEVTVS